MRVIKFLVFLLFIFIPMVPWYFIYHLGYSHEFDKEVALGCSVFYLFLMTTLNGGKIPYLPIYIIVASNDFKQTLDMFIKKAVEKKGLLNNDPVAARVLWNFVFNPIERKRSIDIVKNVKRKGSK